MRGIRARLAGLFATLLILGIIIGLPLVLLAVGASPAHLSVPTLDGIKTALTNPDDGTLALSAVKVIAWVAWAFLTVSIVLEIFARARGVRAPQLPGLRMPQSAAKGMVGMAILLFTASPVTAQLANAAPLPASQNVTASSVAHPGSKSAPQAKGTSHGQQATTPAATHTVKHTVQPGETLWSIARDHLGSGERYTEIAALNHDVLGNKPGFLKPGWTLHLPAPAGQTSTSEHTVTVHAGQTLSGIAQKQLGDANRYPEIEAASKAIVQPGGTHLTNPNQIGAGWTLVIPGSTSSDHVKPVITKHTAPKHAPAPKHSAPKHSAPATPPAVPAPTHQAPAPKATHETPAPSQTHSTPTPTQSADQQTVPHEAQLDQQHASSAPWMLTGLTGAGAILAGSAWLTLRRRRRTQFRARRPGRTIAVPEPELAPVEKTITVVGATSAPTVEQMDTLLRSLAAHATDAGLALPPVAAVELGTTQIVVHLSSPSSLPEPWEGTDDRLHWVCPADGLAGVPADLDQDQPAPYPLLVTIGSSDDDRVWLLNCEDLAAINLTGDATYARDFARYLAAELALNPWSAGVTVDCIGVASEVAGLNPERVRYHDASGDAAAEAVADAVAMIDRAEAQQVDVATGRGSKADDDVWPARLLLVDADRTADRKVVDQLLDLVEQHSGKTGTAIVVSATQSEEPPTGTVLNLSSTGRLTMPRAGLDLVAVGLTADEAKGCATLFANSEVLDDVEIPVDKDATDGWRSFTNEAGALREEHTKPREDRDDETAESVLDAEDADYVAAAATTEEDLKALAPQVPAQVRADIEAADPTLDDDVTAWFNDDCPLPRLTLLGPIHARTHGSAVAVAKRKPYATELLAYLATRPYGATPAQLAEAFDLTEGRARSDIKMVRDWLGVNPRTGKKHLPNARESAAAKCRGVGVYEVEDILVDIDLFRRLRARGEARGGSEGIADLLRALQLVDGRPFDQMRPGGGEWLAGGDRIDHHMNAAIVDVAHMVTTSCLESGDLVRARAAAEIATAVAPDSEIAKLDLVAVFEAEGHRADAERILRDEVCNRSDDGGAPVELSERTEAIIRNHEWLNPDRAAS
ncbi:LysM peptidoglycan-binding domain-containing protein [Flexivirga meconopsidis]|nr:LysM peptidoglycan-binding domain-containing protein [Flexivirga meconopsidis]